MKVYRRLHDQNQHALKIEDGNEVNDVESFVITSHTFQGLMNGTVETSNEKRWCKLEDDLGPEHNKQV